MLTPMEEKMPMATAGMGSEMLAYLAPEDRSQVVLMLLPQPRITVTGE